MPIGGTTQATATVSVNQFGVVHAVAVGSATITASAIGKSASAVVTVTR
jgi:uncharacterized protein YjdB